MGKIMRWRHATPLTVLVVLPLGIWMLSKVWAQPRPLTVAVGDGRHMLTYMDAEGRRSQPSLPITATLIDTFSQK